MWGQDKFYKSKFNYQKFYLKYVKDTLVDVFNRQLEIQV